MDNPLHLAGKLVGIDIPGPTLDEATRRHLERHRFGGVCVFRKNVEHKEQLARLVAEVREVLPDAWVSIDQEGGAVLRTPGLAGFPDAPPAMALGAAGDLSLAERVGAAVGRALISVGINWNYAPDLDVNINPRNPVIGDRSFGSDPRKVAELGLAWARGLEEAGVAATVKHFPGHGDTFLDSHLALPRVDKPLEVLGLTELHPFKQAVEAGVASVMTAHILYPALDPENPATLSEKILTGLLRESWGYDGVIVTDSMGMKAIADNYPAGGAAVKAVQAGADIVLALGRVEVQVEQVEALARAIESGEISRARLAATHRRLDALARRFPGTPRPYPAEAEDRALADEAARRGLTAYGEARAPGLSDRVLLVMADRAVGENVYESGPTAERLTAALGRKFARLSTLTFPKDRPEDALGKLEQAAGAADFLLYASGARGALSDAEVRLANAVFAQGKPALHLALWNPYHAALLGHPALVTYGFRDPSLRALADALAGEPATGKLPVQFA